MPTPSNFLYGGAFKSNYKSLFEDYIKNASPEQRKLWEALKNGNWNVIEEKE